MEISPRVSILELVSQFVDSVLRSSVKFISYSRKSNLNNNQLYCRLLTSLLTNVVVNVIIT